MHFDRADAHDHIIHSVVLPKGLSPDCTQQRGCYFALESCFQCIKILRRGGSFFLRSNNSNFPLSFCFIRFVFCFFLYFTPSDGGGCIGESSQRIGVNYAFLCLLLMKHEAEQASREDMSCRRDGGAALRRNTR